MKECENLPTTLVPPIYPFFDAPADVERRCTAVVQLYIKGFTPSQILDEMKIQEIRVPDNYDIHDVSRDIEIEMIRIRKDNAVALTNALNLEVLRLDQLFSVMYGLGMAGDVRAADEARKLLVERSRLLGLYKTSTPKEADWRDRVIELLDSGKITIEDLKKELGDELAGEVLTIRGYSRDKDQSDDIIDGTATEVAG